MGESFTSIIPFSKETTVRNMNLTCFNPYYIKGGGGGGVELTPPKDFPPQLWIGNILKTNFGYSNFDTDWIGRYNKILDLAQK